MSQQRVFKEQQGVVFYLKPSHTCSQLSGFNLILNLPLNAPSTAIQLPIASGSNRQAALDAGVLICYERTRLFFETFRRLFVIFVTFGLDADPLVLSGRRFSSRRCSVFQGSRWNRHRKMTIRK